MKLTVVTATYNAIATGNRERLTRCIQTVAALKTPHEHLVYDGASVDGTVELLHELEAVTSGLKVVSEKDAGIYNALNKGVRDARGDWFYVLGADDYVLFPTVLDTILQTHADVDEVLVSPVFFARGESLSVSKDYRHNLLFSAPYSHQGVLVRTSLIREYGGFDERYSICADYALMFMCHAAARRIRYLREPFAVFTCGGTSTSAIGSGRPKESLGVIGECCQLTSREKNELERNIVLPWRVLFRFFFHRDATLRLSSMYMMFRRVRYGLKVFGDR